MGKNRKNWWFRDLALQTNGKRNKAKLRVHSCQGGCQYTLAKVGVQLIFWSHRQNRLSVAVWSYFLVRLWVKLLVSKGLIQAFFGLFDGHRMICCNIPCFCWKTSTWSKDNKDSSPSPCKCCLIMVFRSLGRKFLVWKQGNKYITINMAGPP